MSLGEGSFVSSQRIGWMRVKADDFTNRSRPNLETATEAELDRRILPTVLAVGGSVLLTDVLGHVAAPEK
jgi:hypothetical protein